MSETTRHRRLDVLVFRLDGRCLGLPVGAVQEVIRAVATLPPVGGEGPFEGLIDLRGCLIPVFDLRRRLGLPPKAVSPSQHLIVARSAGGRRTALRVDRTLGLERLELDADDGVGLLGGIDSPVEGPARRDSGEPALVLSLDALLRPESGPAEADGQPTGGGAR